MEHAKPVLFMCNLSIGQLINPVLGKKINMSITWKKKSQKGAVAIIQEQKHCKLANFRLLDPDKTSFYAS